MKAKSATEHLERIDFSTLDKQTRIIAARRAKRLDAIDELFFTLRSERRGIVEYLKSLKSTKAVEEVEQPSAKPPAKPTAPQYGMTPERFRALHGGK